LEKDDDGLSLRPDH